MRRALRRSASLLPPLRGKGREGGLAAYEPADGARADKPPSPTLPPQGGEGDAGGFWNGEHAYGRRAGGFAKRLRRELTYTETLLWAELRKLPFHVRKQSPLGPYIADFVIHSSKLVIEVDGMRHELEGAQLYDAVRDAWMRARGFRIIRFTDAQVISDAAGVAQNVLDVCFKHIPSLSRKGDA